MIIDKAAHSYGIKLGLIFGLTMLSLAFLSMGLGLGEPIVVLLASLYKGYAATLVGAIIGLFWGFIHGYVVGAVLVMVNKFIGKH